MHMLKYRIWQNFRVRKLSRLTCKWQFMGKLLQLHYSTHHILRETYIKTYSTKFAGKYSQLDEKSWKPWKFSTQKFCHILYVMLKLPMNYPFFFILTYKAFYYPDLYTKIAIYVRSYIRTVSYLLWVYL